MGALQPGSALAGKQGALGKLTGLTLEPARVVLGGSKARQQLLLTGSYADGSVRDLTRTVPLRSDHPDRVRVEGSIIRAVGDGEVHITALARECTARITVLVKDSGRSPALHFGTDVMPILSKAGCNAGTCHGNFNGKNGFRLSLRGENPAFDLDSLTRDTQGRRTCVFDPDASLILRKPTGRVPHEGGVRFRRDSEEYAVLRRWIAGGLRPDDRAAPALTRLEVTPRRRVLLHGERQQQIVVCAVFRNGVVRDVSHLAVYEPSTPAVNVSPTGLVQAEQDGEATVVVRFLDQRVPCRLAFVPDRPDFRWQEIPARNYIDRHVFTKLRALQIQPSDVCDDDTFLRRAYLDLCGLLPTADAARAFLADRDPEKRDRLLDRPEYADSWALKWADLLRNEEKAVDAKGVRHFHQWIKERVAEDQPLDRFVRALITARGSTYEHPEANYYRTNLDPQKAAETTAQLFLGVRLACARCHNHPFDRWTQEDYHGLSAFFARVRARIADNRRRDRLDKHEINGELIIWIDREGEVSHPQKPGPMRPRLPGRGALALAPGADRLAVLADWITARDNPYFARVMANRIWFHLMGRGLVEPVDDFRESNPAVNEPLLEALAADFMAQGFHPKRLIRRIMASRTYQLSSRPTPSNQGDETNFSHVQPRLLPAEVLLDVLSEVTGVPEEFAGFPLGTRAVQLPGVRGGPNFLKTFGKPDRLLACECERRSDTTLNQAFQLINGEAITRKVAQSPRVVRLLKRKATDAEVITDFYLAALARYPRSSELARIKARLAKASDRRQAVEDLLWAVLNTKEFLLRR
jgi:hypothetical protein